MDIKDLNLPVQKRSDLSKSTLKKLRKNNFIPAIVYGLKQKNLAITLDTRLAKKFSTKDFENKILTLVSEDKLLNGLKVIKKDVSIHPTRYEPIHMDFLSLDMKRPVRVQVEVNFEGKAKGVKEEGGIFNAVLRNVEIECLPANIPQFISIDISELELNQNLHASDLKIPEGSKLITKKTSTLCTVTEAADEAESDDKKAGPEATATEAADKKAAAPAAKTDEAKKASASKEPSKK